MKNRLVKKFTFVLSALCIIALSAINISPANAIPPIFYSGGNGSVENPYQIENCSQLVFMVDNLVAHYILNNDIDCTTYPVGISSVEPSSVAYDLPIGSEGELFEGSFDGQNHTISTVNVEQEDFNQAGVFAIIGESGEVKNLNITGVNITSSQFYSGGLAGTNLGTVSNVTTSGEIAGGIITGGLVGNNTGTITDSSSSVTIDIGANQNAGFAGQNSGTISRSHATGDIHGGEFTAGFVGENYGSIDQSYSTGDAFGSYAYVGGFVGISDSASTISNSYNRGSATSGYTVAGFAGGINAGGVIVNSYTTGKGTATHVDDPLVDVFVADQLGTVTNSFFDSTVAGSTDTTSDAVGKSTSMMKTKSTFTNAGWDFDSIWAINAAVNDGYPTFQYEVSSDADHDGIDNGIEDAAPNGGDANNDGMADSGQNNVASFNNPSTNEYVAVESSDNCEVTSAVVTTESGSSPDIGFNYPNGLVDFALGNCVGSSAQVTLYFYGVNNTNYSVRKYNPTTHTYTNLDGASLTLLSIDGHSVVKASYTIVDNGPLDSNSTVGTIADPAGLGQLVVGAPRTGGGGTATS